MTLQIQPLAFPVRAVAMSLRPKQHRRRPGKSLSKRRTRPRTDPSPKPSCQSSVLCCLPHTPSGDSEPGASPVPPSGHWHLGRRAAAQRTARYGRAPSTGTGCPPRHVTLRFQAAPAAAVGPPAQPGHKGTARLPAAHRACPSKRTQAFLNSSALTLVQNSVLL